MELNELFRHTWFHSPAGDIIPVGTLMWMPLILMINGYWLYSRPEWVVSNMEIVSTWFFIYRYRVPGIIYRTRYCIYRTRYRVYRTRLFVRYQSLIACTYTSNSNSSALHNVITNERMRVSALKNRDPFQGGSSDRPTDRPTDRATKRPSDRATGRRTDRRTVLHTQHISSIIIVASKHLPQTTRKHYL